MIADSLSNSTNEAIFYTFYGAFLLSEIIGAGIIPRLRQRGKPKTESDRGSRGVIFLGVFVSLFVGFGFGFNGVGLLPPYFLYVGLAMMALGVIIRQWAILTLGRYFSLSVRITEGQKVISNGPYRLIRHPSYAGALLSFCGIGLALESWAATLFILLICGSVFAYRIKIEEGVLKAQLGEDYQDYMRRTKRLIPFLV